MSDAPAEIDSLTVEVVVALHRRQLERFGGGTGLRDLGLLDLFHIVSNHPFVDGNKRAGLLAAQVFLDVNGITLEHDTEAFYELTLGVAEGRIDKPAVAAELERIARARLL